jgi:hypothetical protein
MACYRESFTFFLNKWTLLYSLFRLQAGAVMAKSLSNNDWNCIGSFRIKANVYGKDTTRNDQRNLEKSGAPSCRSHWPHALRTMIRTLGYFQVHCPSTIPTIFPRNLFENFVLKDKGGGFKPRVIVPSPRWCMATIKGTIL